MEESKERDVNFAAPLRVTVRLINKETGEVKQQEVLYGRFPAHDAAGHVHHQRRGARPSSPSWSVRPAFIFPKVSTKVGKQLFAAQVIPNRGAWLEYETDSNGVLYVKIDRQRKVHVTALIRALGYGANSEIIELLGEDERLSATLRQGPHAFRSGRPHRNLQAPAPPGEPPTEESARTLLNSLFFDKRYDLARVGRYKFNKKLAIPRAHPQPSGGGQHHPSRHGRNSLRSGAGDRPRTRGHDSERGHQRSLAADWRKPR